MQAAKYHSHSPPMGDDMAKFYRAPFGVHLTRDFIRKTTKQVEACCKEYSRGKYSEYSMIELQAQLHLLQGILFSFKCCRISVNQLLSKEEIETISDLAPLIQGIAPMSGAIQKKEDEMIDAEKISILVSNLAQETSKIILIQLDKVSANEKLLAI